MLSRSCFWVALLAGVGVLIAGCSRVRAARAAPHAAAASVHTSAPAKNLSESQRIEAHAHYAAGVVWELNGQAEQAMAEFVQAARLDPGNEGLVLEVSRRFLLAEQYAQALELLTLATARPNASGALYARLGFVYSRLGQPDLAAKANRTAIRKAPQSIAGYHNMYLNSVEELRYKDALAVLNQAAAAPGTDAEFLVGLGELYANFAFRVPQFKDAATNAGIAVLERALAIPIADPSLSLRLRLADGFNLLGKDAEAASLYADLLKHLPRQVPLQQNVRGKLADIYRRDGQNRALAAEQLEAILREDPTDAHAYFLLGSLAKEDNRYDQAMDCFSKTILLRPNFEPAYVHLALVQIATNRDAEALVTLEKARQRFEPQFVFDYLSGMAAAGLKDYTNAVRFLTSAEIMARATDTNLLDETFYFHFGSVCERMGDCAQAEGYFEKCLQKAPDYAEALNYLGYMWAERGEKLERARALIERALQREPRNAAYLDSMAWVLFKLDQPKVALEYMLKALQHSDEEDATLYDHLGDIYAANGDRDKAVEAWRKSLALEPSDTVRRKLEPAGH